MAFRGRDTNVPDAALTAVLPVPSASSAQLQQLFGAKGFSARELVALSGAHAIGSSQFTAPVVRRCSEPPDCRQWNYVCSSWRVRMSGTVLAIRKTAIRRWEQVSYVIVNNLHATRC